MSSVSRASNLFRTCLRDSNYAKLDPKTALCQQLRSKHSVRVILTRDLPEGQMRGVYAGEVHTVSAGYARNYLLPQRLAVYATPQNFERCGIADPDLIGSEKENLSGGQDDKSEELAAADILKKYLRNKMVKMIRNVDRNTPNLCHPGHVSAEHLRQKLSKQLKIDLDPHETIQIRNEPIAGLEEMDEREVMKIILGMEEDVKGKKVSGKNEGEDGDGDSQDGYKMIEDTNSANITDKFSSDSEKLKDCSTQVKYLGDYLAKITLAGGYVVPLKFRVERR